jgi:hypothetical protein
MAAVMFPVVLKASLVSRKCRLCCSVYSCPMSLDKIKPEECCLCMSIILKWTLKKLGVSG